MKNKEALVEIADQIKNLDNLEKEIHQLKQEKGQLEHNINLLKKNNQEEVNTFNKIKQKLSAEISELEKIVSNLQAKRDAIVSGVIPEISQLNSLKETIARDHTALEEKQGNVNKGFENLSKEQARVEEKKKILEQIISLAKQL